MATRAVIPVNHPDTTENRRARVSPDDAAKELACLVERNMTRKGLSEEEKNQKVGRLAAFLNNLKKSRRKS